MQTERFYRIGGLVFRFFGWLPEVESSDYLPLFEIEPEKPDVELRVCLKDTLDFPTELTPEWEQPYVRSLRIGSEIHRYHRKSWDLTGADYAHLFYAADTPQKRTLELCDRGFALNEKQILATISSEELFLHFGRSVLHSSCVDIGGEVILFSGVSGIGKSTQAALWEEYAGANVKNGDRNLLHCIGGKEYACGLPYAGTSGICTDFTLPIRAIVFLGQAKENSIRRLAQKEAAKLLLSQSPVPNWEAMSVGRAMDAAARIAGNVPVYFLSCLPDRSAVELLQETLKKEPHNGN